VFSQLTIGGTDGSRGRYELSGTAVLNVGVDELVGDAGDGEFLQTGGENTATRLILGHQASGSGAYNLEDGSVSVTAAMIASSFSPSNDLASKQNCENCLDPNLRHRRVS
jgi:hypothetical protein